MQIKEQINQWGKERIPFVFLIDFELQKPLAYPLSDCPSVLKYNFDGKTNYQPEFSNTTASKLETDSVDFQRFKKKFDLSQKHLNRGDTYLINLTDKTPIKSELNFEALFKASTSKYTIWLENEFISFSPETFVTIKNGVISTYPMKGTIKHRDEHSEKELRDNLKEQSEHATVVDLLRNDLSRVSKKVSVDQYRYYEVLQTSESAIGQISSKITGLLEGDYQARLGDILFDLLPAGSICGAPKDKTVRLIGEIEDEPRGYYTGVAFYYDGAELDSCVMIRYIDKDHNYRSGGGITNMSKLDDEYQELKSKVYVPIV
jgi:para-aminobenzoate synthetase component 1